MASSSFHDFVVGDVLGHIPGIRSRKMFGGWGIYKEGKIFAIIADEALWFKVHEGNRALFEKAGSRSFTYRNRGKVYEMAYWSVPEAVINDRRKIEMWVESSLAAPEKKVAKSAPTKKIVYRVATQGDLSDIQRLQKQLNTARERQFIKETKKFHARKKAHSLIEVSDLRKDVFVVAEVQGKVVGYAWGQLAERSSSVLSRLGYIEEVCVDEKHRGKGIAKKLLEELAQLFRKKGCDHMTTHTDAENSAAQALYRSFDMIPVTLELWKPL